jgi:hypothetical protein
VDYRVPLWVLNERLRKLKRLAIILDVAAVVDLVAVAVCDQVAVAVACVVVKGLY